MYQRIEADVQWMRVVQLDLMPNHGVKQPGDIEADYQMKDRILVLDMRETLFGHAL